MGTTVTCFIFMVVALFGIIMPKSKPIKWLIMFIIFVLFTFSVDKLDYYVYESNYNLILDGGSSVFEVMFILSANIGHYLGLSYIEFRGALAAIELLVLNRIFSKQTENSTFVWALYLLFSAPYDYQLLRHCMAMIFALMAFPILYNKTHPYGMKEIIRYYILVILAGLSHSSFWIFLLFMPLTLLSNKKKILFIVISTVLVFSGGVIYLILSVYSLLPIRLTSITQYFDGDYANIKGLLYNTISQIMYMIPSIWYYFKYNHTQDICYKYSSSPNAAILYNNLNLWLSFNILFCFILPFQIIAVNFRRMQRLLAIVNYIFIGRISRLHPQHGLKIRMGGLLYVIVLLIHSIVGPNASNLVNVWQPLFESNPLFNWFNS